ncbi:MAG: acyl carrier protein [Alphaproteobacteria bacterium]|nr:acyl carrier protein [Alphaproteobacteria bacterium]
MDDIENRICDIIAKEARVDRALVTSGATLDDLKIASVDLVQIVFALEEGFDITIPEEAVKLDVKNVGEVVAAVKQLVLAKSTGAKGA